MAGYVAAEHCLPPWGASWKIDGREWKVGAWLHEQRRIHGKGRLSQERLAALDAAAPGWKTARSEEIYWAQVLAQVGWI